MRVRGRFTRAPIDDAALAGANHFHPIRLVAALLVLFAHAFHLLDRGGEEPIGHWFLSLDASLAGVVMFFFISGFLVARSWDARRSLADFARARALRIVPALWLALVLMVFVIGPVFTTHAPGEYLADPLTWKYLALNAILRTQYLLPGVFESNPLPGINGSLWTIPLEVSCYAILGATGATALLSASPHAMLERLRRAPVVFIGLALIGLALAIKISITSPTYVGLALEFLLGVVVYRFRRVLVLDLRIALVLLVAAIALARTTLPFIPGTHVGPHIGVGVALMAVALPYGLLVVALHPAFAGSSTWLHRHDYSYGTYLFGFPVQQAAIALGVRDPWVLLAIAVPATLALAAFSWHIVERPALSLKRNASALGSRKRFL